MLRCPKSDKLCFAKDCGLIPGLLKLGGCELTFILCDQFCLSTGNKSENPAIQGLRMYGPKSHLILALWFKQHPVRSSALEKYCHPMFL